MPPTQRPVVPAPRRAVRLLAAASGAVLAAGVAAAVAAGPAGTASAAPAAAEVAAGEGLCIDLSPLNLPSMCVGRLLGSSAAS